MKEKVFSIMFLGIVLCSTVGCSNKATVTLPTEKQNTNTSTIMPTQTQSNEAIANEELHEKSSDNAQTEIAPEDTKVDMEYNLEAEVFAEIPLKAGEIFHGITFDNDNNMYLIKQNLNCSISYGVIKRSTDGKISEIIDFKEYSDKTGEKVRVNNLAVSADNNLYIVGSDKVFRISDDGTMSSVINDNDGCQWGYSDIIFDLKGNLYVSHGSKISIFSPDFTEIGIIDINEDETNKSRINGICLDKNYEYLYVCDSAKSRIVKCSINTDAEVDTHKVYPVSNTNSPLFITSDVNGNIIATSHDGKIFYYIDPKDNLKVLNIDPEIEGANTLCFGKSGYDDTSIFISMIGNKIMKISVNDIQ